MRVSAIQQLLQPIQCRASTVCSLHLIIVYIDGRNKLLISNMRLKLTPALPIRSLMFSALVLSNDFEHKAERSFGIFSVVSQHFCNFEDENNTWNMIICTWKVQWKLFLTEIDLDRNCSMCNLIHGRL